jgi:hypothetical protein
MMAISIVSFHQIPEVLDEIFRCSTIATEMRTEISTRTRSIVVGAAKVDIPPEFDNEDVLEVVSVIGNAIEVQPYSSFLTNETRRRYGQRGMYFNLLTKWIGSGNAQIDMLKARTVLAALARYPDVFLTQVLARTLRQPKPAGILKAMWELSDERLREYIKAAVLAKFNAPVDVDYTGMRSLAYFASTVMSSHPAMEMPPILGPAYGPISPTRYPLTRCQVGTLRRDRSLCESHPLRPYTLSYRGEIEEILHLLNQQFGDNGIWRLPKATEWKLFAVGGPSRWPWGDADPERGRHAHLGYIDGGAIASHPLEVGVFPDDNSDLRDLIGNVYEVVRNDSLSNDLELAGGSWTTAFNDSSTSRFSIISHWVGKSRDNVGIRPVWEPCRTT